MTTKSEDDTAPADERTSVRTVDFEYDDKGRPHKEWTEKASTSGDLKQTVTTEYGSSGEVTSVLKEAPGTASRETRYEYTPLVSGWPNEKIYPTQVWSPHSDTTKRPSVWTLTHPGYGLAVATEDINGVITTTKYDDLGRVVETTPPGESAITTSYANRTDTYGGVNGMVVTTSCGLTGTNQEESQTFSDRMGRTIRSTSRGLDGTWSATDSRYDVLGHAVAVSRPYFASGSAHASAWTTTDFDTLDRPTRTTNADNTFTRVTYPSPFETRHFDENNNESFTVADLNGRTVTSGTVSDSGDVKVTFKQGPSGVLETTDTKNTTTSTYDTLGRLTKSVDANAGTTTHKYNGFGDIRENGHSETSNRQVLSFDDLGRTTTVEEYTGLAMTGQSTTVWDTSAHGIGKVDYTTSRDGIKTAYRYDVNGRPAGTDYTDGSTVYSTDLTYTTVDRPDTVAYPQVAGRTDRFTVKYQYTSFGQLSEVGDNSPGRAYRKLWKTNGLEADGSLTQGSYGNNAITTVRDYYPDTGRLKKTTDTNSASTKLTETGYEYYDNGTVKRRNDTVVNHRDETYTYDKLNRLDGWSLTTPSTLSGPPPTATAPAATSTRSSSTAWSPRPTSTRTPHTPTPYPPAPPTAPPTPTATTAWAGSGPGPGGPSPTTAWP
ncbi:hypothetical protein [Streptomyces sp. NPDC060002]|uniref:hypothetical protein n=1 Tax=Streptomyces sp. NPDC060002 TaxID=3347033 RepID=UPI0036B84852